VKTFLIECGVSVPSADGTIALDVRGASRNVNLRIDYITRGMLGNVPDLLIDLLEIAAYVYCGDQRASRGSDKLTNYGEHWRRDLNFTIPVRYPEIWDEPQINDVLCKTLGFLSDDSYSFKFARSKGLPHVRTIYFPELIEASAPFDEVALFSGGIDSFAGAVDDIVLKGKSILLVGHYASTKVRSVQDSLIASLKQRGFGQRVSFVPVWVANKITRPVDFTQRTRSFLFACLGLVIARMAGKDSFTFYENGVVSLNPPIAGDVVGARATRTMHPQVLRGLENLFSLLLDHRIRIETPLQWMTKAEVVHKIQEAGLSDLVRMTFSCTRPYQSINRHPHCGECSQCIDRRFAVLGAGMAEHEPADSYKLDLLTADRTASDSLRMALSYVAFFKKLGATSKGRFLVDYPEIVSALDHFSEMNPHEAGERVYDLFQRQAEIVQLVISDGLREHAQALYRQELPSGCLLALSTSIGHLETPPLSDYDAQTKAFIDRLNTPILEFAIDTSGKRVLFRGGIALDGANFRLVDVLFGNFRKAKAEEGEVPFLPATNLADRLQISEQSMRQQLGRLRESLKPLAPALGIPLDPGYLYRNQGARRLSFEPETPGDRGGRHPDR
jgi:hypothetical protein